MKQLFDEIDASGNVMASGILLVPGLTLPEGHQWVPHLPSIETVKAEKKLEIETRRNYFCFKPVDAIGYTWQSDQRSQDLINSAILLAQLNISQPTTWRTLDNQDIVVTLDDLKAIASAIAAQTQLAYQTSWELKAELEVATTREQVAQIVWR